MGEPKLLLPFGATSVIESALAAWRASQVTEVIVVVRSNDRELAARCAQAGAQVAVPPVDPPDMKASVRHGLDFAARQFGPAGADVWLLAPADTPRLSPLVVDSLLADFAVDRSQIVVPVHGGRRGHPVLFPWALASRLGTLGSEQGVNALLREHPVRQLPCGDPSVLDELNTPQDYRRLRAGTGGA